MQSAVEISMYPLTGDYRPLIQAFIDRLNTYPELRVAHQLAEHAGVGTARSGDEHPRRGDGALGSERRRNRSSS